MTHRITIVFGRISLGLLFFAAVLFCALLVMGTPNIAYRPNSIECIADDATACERNYIKEWDNRWIGFVELTDAGKYQHLPMMQQVLARLGDEAKDKDVLIVTYVHGWRHNAHGADENVAEFEALVAKMADDEASRPPAERRKVIGVYVGWRGSSVDRAPFWIPTFWSRKAVAEDIGHSVTAIFATINKEWVNANRICRPNSAGRRGNTRMLTIGHSFGGLIVARSSLPLMINAVHSEALDPLEALGDMVVLINPAIEASAFLGLRSQLHEFPKTATRNPALVVVTSDADWATRFAFPFGRIFTVWDRSVPSWEEWGLMLRTIGHVDQFITHKLSSDKGQLKFEDKTSTSDWLPKNPVYRRATTPFWFVKTDGSVVKSHSDFSVELREFTGELFAKIAKDAANDPRQCIDRNSFN